MIGMGQEDFVPRSKFPPLFLKSRASVVLNLHLSWKLTFSEA